MLAAVAYSRDPVGVKFINEREWGKDNLFSARSIWDIPLVSTSPLCVRERKGFSDWPKKLKGNLLWTKITGRTGEAS